MANTKQAKKRIKLNNKSNLANVQKRTMLRTHMKNVRKAAATGSKEATAVAHAKAVPVIDKMVNKGIIHRNAAARYKSRLNAVLKALVAAA